MSTRGFVGFVLDSTEKIAYVHFDADPDGLGVRVLTWLSGAEVMRTAEQVRALRMVELNSTPTAEDIARLAEWTNFYRGSGCTSDWYCLLRETQGRPAEILRAGVMLDARDFPLDPRCAWGYLVDLDAAMFEVYRGYQGEPHDRGRFAIPDYLRADRVPVALVASWPLGSLPDRKHFLMTFKEDA